MLSSHVLVLPGAPQLLVVEKDHRLVATNYSFKSHSYRRKGRKGQKDQRSNCRTFAKATRYFYSPQFMPLWTIEVSESVNLQRHR